MVTMSEVARLANVSVTTVSHVVNNSRKVNPETERAVRRAIASTGYSGDVIARSLRRGSTETIGVAISAISNPYFGEVVHAVERGATAQEYTLLLADTHDDSDRELRAILDLLSHRVDGVILAPSARPDRALSILASRGLPVVLIDRVPPGYDDTVDAIGVANVEPTASLVDHLADVHGHRRIGMIAPAPGVATTVERIEGYRLGLERNGLRFDEALLGFGGSADDARTEEAVTRMLGRPAPPTALVLGNNAITVETVAALRRRGLVPPVDIATVSFDDFPWADSFHPRLTVMSQPVDRLGGRAVEMLLERIANPTVPPRHVRLEPTFERRESCGCSAP